MLHLTSHWEELWLMARTNAPPSSSCLPGAWPGCASLGRSCSQGMQAAPSFLGTFPPTQTPVMVRTGVRRSHVSCLSTLGCFVHGRRAWRVPCTGHACWSGMEGTGDHVPHDFHRDPPPTLLGSSGCHAAHLNCLAICLWMCLRYSELRLVVMLLLPPSNTVSMKLNYQTKISLFWELKPRRKSRAAWLLQQAHGFRTKPWCLTSRHFGWGRAGFWRFWSPPTPWFFSHGQDPPMNLPLQPAPALGEQESHESIPRLSVHPSIPHPCPVVPCPGGGGPSPAPRKGPICDWGDGTQETCRKLCGVAGDGKIPGICPFSKKTSELGGVFLSIQSARPLGNFLCRLPAVMFS